MSSGEIIDLSLNIIIGVITLIVANWLSLGRLRLQNAAVFLGLCSWALLNIVCIYIWDMHNIIPPMGGGDGSARMRRFAFVLGVCGVLGVLSWYRQYRRGSRAGSGVTGRDGRSETSAGDN